MSTDVILQDVTDLVLTVPVGPGQRETTDGVWEPWEGFRKGCEREEDLARKVEAWQHKHKPRTDSHKGQDLKGKKNQTGKGKKVDGEQGSQGAPLEDEHPSS